MAQAKTSRAEFDAKIAAATNMDWIRLAAFIDGEGTIFIQRTRTKKGKGPMCHVLTVVVANTDVRLMQWLSNTFTGVSYIIHQANPTFPIRKAGWSWRMFDDRAAVILRHCLPYFICKKEQADIGLAYRELRQLGSKGRRLTPADLAARDAFYWKVRELNSGSRPPEETSAYVQ